MTPAGGEENLQEAFTHPKPGGHGRKHSIETQGEQELCKGAPTSHPRELWIEWDATTAQLWPGRKRITAHPLPPAASLSSR